MRVLVTGGTGFVGNYVINYLLNEGHDLIAIVRDIQKATTFSWFTSVTVIEYNLNNPLEKNLFTYFGKPDRMIHLAWEGLPNYKSINHVEQLNVQFTFIKKMIESGLSDLTVVGTCLEYGLKNGMLTEEDIPEPNNPYAIAKNMLRIYIEELNKHFNFCFKWVRLFYLFGEGQAPSSLWTQMNLALKLKQNVFNMSGGEQLRDFLSIEQTAKYISAISIQNKEFGIINCCSGTPISVRNFVEQFFKQKFAMINLNLGYYPYLDYEPLAFWGNNQKLKKILSND